MLEDFIALLRKAEDVFVMGELPTRAQRFIVAPVMGVAAPAQSAQKRAAPSFYAPGDLQTYRLVQRAAARLRQ